MCESLLRTLCLLLDCLRYVECLVYICPALVASRRRTQLLNSPRPNAPRSWMSRLGSRGGQCVSRVQSQFCKCEYASGRVEGMVDKAAEITVGRIWELLLCGGGQCRFESRGFVACMPQGWIALFSRVTQNRLATPRWISLLSKLHAATTSPTILPSFVLPLALAVRA